MPALYVITQLLIVEHVNKFGMFHRPQTQPYIAFNVLLDIMLLKLNASHVVITAYFVYLLQPV